MCLGFAPGTSGWEISRFPGNFCLDPGKFPVYGFPDSQEICWNSGKLLTFERYCIAAVLTANVNLFKLEHHSLQQKWSSYV